MIVYTDKHRVPFEIDEDDFEAVSRYAWHINRYGYPATKIGKWPRARTISLHMFVLGRAPAGLEWDHRDRDKTNNRRGNLRAVTRSVNGRNKGLQTNNKSGVKGVCWQEPNRKWRADIGIEGRLKYLGLFATLAEAAAARGAAEAGIWGDAK